MTDRTFFIDRAKLFGVFRDPVIVRQFEEMQDIVGTTSDVATANVAETQALRDASFVTLSSNAELTNERVLSVGPGLSLSASDTGVTLTSNVYSDDGWPVQFNVTGATVLELPTAGIVATRSGAEALSNKTLAAPKLSGLGDYADDTAAASGGVPVGGVYHNSGALRVRLA